MRLKKREISNSRREMNVQEGDGVKKMESPSLRGRLDMYVCSTVKQSHMQNFSSICQSMWEKSAENCVFSVL